MQITVWDQDKALAESLCATLQAAGHRAVRAADAEDVLEQVRQAASDLLLLDIAAPGAGSAMPIRAVRQMAPAMPILLLCPRASTDEIAAALDAGAADFLIKPVRHAELVTRVQVLLQRAYPAQHAGELLQFGSYAFATASGSVVRDGKPVEVTQKEFDLALLFFRHLGRPLSRAYIRESIWPGDAGLPSRTLDTHVSRVRNKLDLRPENGYRLSPVYSYGYQLERLSP